VLVVWYTRKRPLLGVRPAGERAWILATMQSYRAIGIDEQRQVFNATTNQNDTIVVGQRAFTLVVRAESLDADLEAFDLCERVRFRFRSQTARALMVPNLALVDFAPIMQHDEMLAGAGDTKRQLLSSTLDVRMAAVVAADALDPNEGSWIETFDAPTAVLLVDGDTVSGKV